MEDPKIINGKKIAGDIISEIKSELSVINIKPGLALILVGNNPASEIYVKMKEKKCRELGYYSIVDRQPSDITEKKLLELIYYYNNSPEIHGILIQLPLPPHINENRILESVDYRKDVDGFHPFNTGRLLNGNKCFIPCTPAGIHELIKRHGIETRGKNLTVIGRSNIVGKPVAMLMLQKNKFSDCTVTVCHSSTVNITEYTSKADIIIAAIGKANFVKSDMIKEGCVIIDVGINRIDDINSPSGYKIYGDVDFSDCYPKVSAITPVPGGVGPMTIAMLMKNTLDSAMKRIYD